MGLYINPKEGTKEDWLAKHGEEQTSVPRHCKVGTKIVVCLIGNVFFTAAGWQRLQETLVMYRQAELEEFADPIDTRPKRWFLVEEKDIRDVCGQRSANFYLGTEGG
jgi:hypothetical protein